MKSFKIYAPVILLFALLTSTTVVHAQSTFAEVNAKHLANKSNADATIKTIGLIYEATLNQLNTVLVAAIKSNNKINYQGHVIVELKLDATGKASIKGFNRAIPFTLKSTITKAITSTRFTPIQLNGISKTHSIRIPIYIK